MDDDIAAARPFPKTPQRELLDQAAESELSLPVLIFTVERDFLRQP